MDTHPFDERAGVAMDAHEETAVLRKALRRREVIGVQPRISVDGFRVNVLRYPHDRRAGRVGPYHPEAASDGILPGPENGGHGLADDRDKWRAVDVAVGDRAAAQDPRPHRR